MGVGLMTKQDILKAIENGESVWCVYKDQSNIYEIKAVEIEKVLNNTFLWGKEYYSNRKDVFKTKAEAEHYLHHANISRTETLPFLTWEEFNKNTLGFEFTDTIENKYRCHIVRDYRDGEDFIVLYDKNGTISVDEEWEATEENFYKAYDECVRWFRGGE